MKHDFHGLRNEISFCSSLAWASWLRPQSNAMVITIRALDPPTAQTTTQDELGAALPGMPPEGVTHIDYSTSLPLGLLLSVRTAPFRLDRLLLPVPLRCRCWLTIRVLWVGSYTAFENGGLCVHPYLPLETRCPNHLWDLCSALLANKLQTDIWSQTDKMRRPEGYFMPYAQCLQETVEVGS